MVETGEAPTPNALNQAINQFDAIATVEPYLSRAEDYDSDLIFYRIILHMH